MKTNFTIKVKDLKEYHKIASELIMLGYADDTDWNRRMIIEFDDRSYENLYVHVCSKPKFSLFNFGDFTYDEFENIEHFLTSVFNIKK